MKKLIIVLSLFGLLGGCQQWLVEQLSFTPDLLMKISPTGLEFGKQVGKNWWDGDYKGKPVIIHAVETHGYVSVDFKFIP